SVAALVPLARELLVGPWLTSALDLDLAAAIRLPILHDTGAIQLTLLGGYATLDATWTVGARVGPWFAFTPTWAAHLDLGVATRGLHEREATVTFGLSRLIPLTP
ncbi:MAG: hypothetical protein NT062_10105, partial [Proteobacteria bacterium]|nr:hypothetical protein [Pseudomonadota bacterium]